MDIGKKAPYTGNFRGNFRADPRQSTGYRHPSGVVPVCVMNEGTSRCRNSTKKNVLNDDRCEWDSRKRRCWVRSADDNDAYYPSSASKPFVSTTPVRDPANDEALFDDAWADHEALLASDNGARAANDAALLEDYYPSKPVRNTADEARLNSYYPADDLTYRAASKPSVRPVRDPADDAALLEAYYPKETLGDYDAEMRML
jgi:hypothetical protein